MIDLRNLIVLGLVLVGIVGCGGSANDEARKVDDQSVIGDPRPLPDSLITDEMIDETDAGSPERALLEFWSALQFQSFSEAVNFYEPGMRSAIGKGQMIEALAGQAPRWRSRRPEIVSTKRDGNRATVNFTLKDSEADAPTSITWEKEGDAYRISYDPYLDFALSAAAQTEVQQRVAPTAQTPSPEALRAGADAGRLQSDYVEQRSAGGTQKAPRAKDEDESG